jgi:hypothetical protein
VPLNFFLFSLEFCIRFNYLPALHRLAAHNDPQGDIMDKAIHTFSELFRQLGLPDDPASIELFLATHRPQPNNLSLCKMSCWTASQAEFLHEELMNDGDWAELIDALGLRLRD